MFTDGVPSQDGLSFKTDGEELRQLLIEQFQEDAVGRYGPASEQARALSRFLVED